MTEPTRVAVRTVLACTAVLALAGVALREWNWARTTVAARPLAGCYVAPSEHSVPHSLLVEIFSDQGVGTEIVA